MNDSACNFYQSKHTNTKKSAWEALKSKNLSCAVQASFEEFETDIKPIDRMDHAGDNLLGSLERLHKQIESLIKK